MKRVIITLILAASVISVSAQRHLDSLTQYRRSSLYSVLIQHSTMENADVIHDVYFEMPIPDKFNDHNLDNRTIESTAKRVIRRGKSKKKDRFNFADVEAQLIGQGSTQEMVAKWFNRDAATGICNHDLIGERGLYDASQYEIAIADQTILGRSDLANNGMELIGNTYLLVNDVTFVDKGKGSRIAAEIIIILGELFDVDMGDLGKLVNEYDGYRINVTSYLYRLEWDKERLQGFYDNYYISSRMSPEEQRARYEAFKKIANSDTTVFGISYVGRTKASGNVVSLKSYARKTKEEQFLIACTRAMDKSLVNLQREYEAFKVNVPIYRINDNGTVDVQIGLKEGVNKKSKYQVLMPELDENGTLSYREIGTIVPIEGKIWDNRFGALEEAEFRALENKAAKGEAAEGNAYLDATTFKVVGAVDANKFIGCVVREQRIAKSK